MAVTGSTFNLEGEQADGSRWCREIHTLTGGSQIEFYYLTPPDFDPVPVVEERGIRLADIIADREAEENFDRDGPPTLQHQTGAQFAARFRAAAKEGTRERACYLAWWLLRRIAAGHITDAQCRTAFGGLTTTQWNSLKTSTLTPRSNAYAAMMAAGGI